ncbi:Cytochrome P450 2W1 [Frankliniella fusca]|uniref:Cytochrome P450 2W1 n=1 Tax=Frankliniella fusca TaxID=407009 RepID=A0AAE1HLR0_9NEOP|nr:Cytochrome P450 2W1 [Frankliniella fusca]
MGSLGRSGKPLFLGLRSYPRLPYKDKLPSTREVLSVFLHAHSVERKTLSAAADIACSQVIEVYSLAGIDVQLKTNLTRKIIGVYNEYKKLEKRRRSFTVPGDTPSTSHVEDAVDETGSPLGESIEIEQDEPNSQDCPLNTSSSSEDSAPVKTKDTNFEPTSYHKLSIGEIQKKKEVSTPVLNATLDWAKLSDRKATALIAAT